MKKEHKNSLLEEWYFEAEHTSGLKIFVLPKSDYKTNFAIIGVPFGSADKEFVCADGKHVVLPDGTAHFLEHKLFESEEKDAFEKFAQTGARANAYTSFDRTCYLFSCSENFEKNLASLLEFVGEAYFTGKTVAKEQGIIAQEIKMYRDNPEWQATMGLFSALYQNTAVNTDIAGSVASIATITPEILYAVYDAFYAPQNMVLAVCGNVQLEQVLRVCDQCVKAAAKPTAQCVIPDEPVAPVAAKVVKRMPVSKPVFAFGYKENKHSPVSLKERILTVILNQIIIGNMSPLYNTLLEKGVIGEDFGSEYFTGKHYATVLFTGSSENATYVKEQFEKEVERVKKEGIDCELFHCVIKDMYGTIIKSFNSVEDIATEMLESALGGYGFFDEMEIFQSATVEQVQALLAEKYQVSSSAISLVLPLENA